MTRILIVPGFNGSDVGHWQHHWLQDDLNAQLVEQESWAIRFSGTGFTNWNPTLSPIPMRCWSVIASVRCSLLIWPAVRPRPMSMVRSWLRRQIWKPRKGVTRGGLILA